MSIVLDKDIYEFIKLRSESEGTATLSKTVRRAIERFDFDAIQVEENESKQICVRLPSETRLRLKNPSKAHGVSINHLVKRSLQAYLKNDKLCVKQQPDQFNFLKTAYETNQ
jgi:hypothetical protein